MDWAFLLIVSTPLILAAMGEVVGQRSGVLNIGLEGMMLTGSFTGFYLAERTNSLPIAFAGAVAVGLFLALVSGYFTVKLGADQVVVGTAINFFALGATGLAFRRVYGQAGQLDPIPAVPKVLGLDPIVLLAVALVPVAWWLIYRTRWGLALRACGEYPKAVEAAGFSVVKVRMVALAIGGALAGLAGAHLALGIAGSFAEGMTAGRGFLAIALVTFGRWQPVWAALAALLLGFTQSLQYSMQGNPILGVEVPSQLWLALPYVVALLVLVFVGTGTVTPNALGKPYEKEA